MAEFFDVEGIPVSVALRGSPFGCTAWDCSPPRPFDPGSARRNGTSVSEDKFRALVLAKSRELAAAIERAIPQA